MFEEKSLAATGLRLEKVRAEEVLIARGEATAHARGYCRYRTLATGLRPDFTEAQENRFLRADS